MENRVKTGKTKAELLLGLEEMEQTARIEKMEKLLDEAAPMISALGTAAEGYAAIAEKLAELAAYYESPLWRCDFEDDERGLLPHDLKRGVLSEDGVYDLLYEAERIKKLILGSADGADK